MDKHFYLPSLLFYLHEFFFLFLFISPFTIFVVFWYFSTLCSSVFIRGCQIKSTTQLVPECWNKTVRCEIYNLVMYSHVYVHVYRSSPSKCPPLCKCPPPYFCLFKGKCQFLVQAPTPSHPLRFVVIEVIITCWAKRNKLG